jgi:hypothetical protein
MVITLVVRVEYELNVAVTPVGSPETDRATLLPRLEGLFTATVICALEPSNKVSALAEGAREKLGTGIVSEIMAVFVATPNVPVTAMG